MHNLSAWAAAPRDPREWGHRQADIRTIASEHAQEHENNNDQQNQSEPSTRVGAPTPAVGPCGNCSDQQENQNNQKNRHRSTPWTSKFCSRPVAFNEQAPVHLAILR
jgi:hypothetical protein